MKAMILALYITSSVTALVLAREIDKLRQRVKELEDKIKETDSEE